EVMQGQRVADITQIDELVDLAVGITGDVHQRRFAAGPCLEAIERHDREELTQGPVIQQRLEYRKIAQILIAQAVFQLSNLFGDIRLSAEAGYHRLADQPVQRFNLRLVLQFHEAQDKHV